ncbi:MAG: hypothetical protein BWY71_01327 [Planctomycetes bacterium ADurb.Bin412]|nr:MAG: hypothetical protein BWY71_01327 [Planctomycetes bacterium ADurb.Bin412]
MKRHLVRLFRKQILQDLQTFCIPQTNIQGLEQMQGNTGFGRRTQTIIPDHLLPRPFKVTRLDDRPQQAFRNLAADVIRFLSLFRRKLPRLAGGLGFLLPLLE